MNVNVDSGAWLYDRGATTKAMVIAVWMPNQIPSLNLSASPFTDPYHGLCPSILDYFYNNGTTRTHLPAIPEDGWTPGNVYDIVPLTSEIGTINTDFISQMKADGWKFSPIAIRTVDGIGTHNVDKIRLDSNRSFANVNGVQTHTTHTYNSTEYHGFYRRNYKSFGLDMTPANFSGTIPDSWFTVDGEHLSPTGMLASYKLWGEGWAGNPGSGYSVPFQLQDVHSDGQPRSDPGMKLLWDAMQTDASLTMANFSARPKPGYWSFWFLCPRTSRMGPVWYNRAGCSAGNLTAIDANSNDPFWFPDNWAQDATGDLAAGAAGSYQNPGSVWDVTDTDGIEDEFGNRITPLFSGINGDRVTRYTVGFIRPLIERVIEGYSVVSQPLEFDVFKDSGGAPTSSKSRTIGGVDRNWAAKPSSELVHGILLTHPVSKVPDGDLMTDATCGVLSVATDAVVGSDPSFGRLGYGAQTDDEFDTLYVANGPNQLLAFDTGFDGVHFKQAIDRTNGVWDFGSNNTVIQRFVTSFERALHITISGNVVSTGYVVGTSTGLGRTNADADASPGSAAQTLFFNPPQASDDPEVKVFGQTYTVAIGVTNEYRLPVYRI